MKVFFQALLVWVALLVSSLSCAGEISLNQPLPINPALAIEYLEDPSGDMDLDTAMGSEFQPLNQELANFGFTRSKFWLRFTLHNPDELPRTLVLRTFDRVLRPLMIFQDGEQIYFTDEHTPFQARPHNMRHMGAEVTVAGQARSQIHVYFGAGSSASIPLALVSRDQIIADTHSAMLRTFLFVSIIGTLIVSNLFYFVALRAWSFLLYAMMQISAIFYCLNIEGFGFQYIWPNWPAFNSQASPILGGFSHLFAVWFSISFLQSKQYTPRFYFVLCGMLFVLGGYILAAAALPSYYTNQFGLLMTFAVTTLLLPHAIYVVLKGHKSARFYLAGWVVLLTIIIYFNSVGIGLIDPLLPPLFMMELGITIEAIILSLGLADQYRRLNEENQRNQAELVAQLDARLAETKERVALEIEKDQALQSVLEKSKVLASTSHDIAQPIRSLRLALESVASDIKRGEVLDALRVTLDNMEEVIGDALGSASGELQSATEQADVNIEQVLSEVAEQFHPEAIEKGLFIRVHAPSEQMRVNHQLLKRCLLNLLSNAVRYTAEGGVLVAARRRTNGMLVQVFDTGFGIAAEEQDQLFNFHERSEDSPGHGLGLALVRDACHQASWDLTLKSKLRKGSCFSILLPNR